MRRRTMVTDFREALAHVDQVLVEGEATHHGAWRRQPVREHVEHAIAHLNAWQAGATDEDHLGHASTRLLMALQLAAGEVVP